MFEETQPRPFLAGRTRKGCALGQAVKLNVSYLKGEGTPIKELQGVDRSIWASVRAYLLLTAGLLTREG
jgi:hypothetical protein